jgi:hypothetical protein
VGGGEEKGEDNSGHGLGELLPDSGSGSGSGSGDAGVRAALGTEGVMAAVDECSAEVISSTAVISTSTSISPA